MISVDKEYVSYFKVWEICPPTLKIPHKNKDTMNKMCTPKYLPIELIWGLQINTSKKFKTVPAHGMSNKSIC